MSLGLPEPLRTAFELKNDLRASKNEPDAATLTLHKFAKNAKKLKSEN